MLDIVNKSPEEITKNLKADHEVKLAEWQKQTEELRLSDKPKVNAGSWLIQARRSRVLSTFPILDILTETKQFCLAGHELNRDGRAWLVPDSVNLGRLKETDSPYEKHLDYICAPRHCPKLAAVDHLIKDVWDKGEKAVFVTMGPVNALIVYWWLHKTKHAEVALIHSQLKKNIVTSMVNLFQEDPQEIAENPKVKPPQYIVGTTSLIGQGITLTAARRLVQMEAEWYVRDERQARKRINRIPQKKKTYTYQPYCVGSTVETVIINNQMRRENLFDKVLTNVEIDDEQVRLNMGDDDESPSDKEEM